MSAKQKEQIYIELREYHLDEFPESLSNSSMNELLSEYRALEDDVINMLLSFVNGKAEYTDMSENISKFIDKAKPNPSGDKSEDADRKHFILKIEQLKSIIEMAKDTPFKLRRVRNTRPSTREVITKVNKSS